MSINERLHGLRASADESGGSSQLDDGQEKAVTRLEALNLRRLPMVTVLKSGVPVIIPHRKKNLDNFFVGDSGIRSSRSSILSFAQPGRYLAVHFRFLYSALHISSYDWWHSSSQL